MHATPPSAPTELDRLLRLMVERKASDLHIKAGSPPGLRVDGAVLPLNEPVLSPEDTRRLAEQVLTEEQRARFREEGDADLSYSIAGVSRFRVNVLTQRGAVGMVIRRIPSEIPTLASLGLPDACQALSNRPRGLVLVTGPTGSGKSTTLAAMVDYVNATRNGHILTMEDPIEFVHADKKCWVTQREIGADTTSFAGALRRALRQDPDVILVGEMRDLETISLAVTAAETGHLVFATLHTTGAVQTINRIVDVFPGGQQQQIRMQLADTLQGIVCQTLLPKVSGGRACAMEILVATDGVRGLIRENKTSQIHNLIQMGAKDGMCTLEMSLNQLLAQRAITLEAAASKANFPNQLDGGRAVGGPGGEPPRPARPARPAAFARR